LAVGEGGFQLVADVDGVGEGAHGAEGEGVLDVVGDERAADAFAGFGGDAVAVGPGGEGAFDLDVDEVAVPDEFGDEGDPAEAEGQERDGAEAEGDLGIDAGGGALEAQGWVGGDGARRGRDEAGAFDAGALAFGHEVGEVGRVGAEGEDELDRMRGPLGGGEGFGHERRGLSGLGSGSRVPQGAGDLMNVEFWKRRAKPGGLRPGANELRVDLRKELQWKTEGPLNKFELLEWAFPQGLKSIDYAGFGGTTEVAPFQSAAYSEVA